MGHFYGNVKAYRYTEPCQSGRMYLFAKEAGCKSPRWFESSRFRKIMVDPTLNSILKTMWALDEKIVMGLDLNEDEKEFYNKNLQIITEYYSKNNEYWNNKTQQ